MWHQKHVEVIVSENRIIAEMRMPTAGSSESTRVRELQEY